MQQLQAMQQAQQAQQKTQPILDEINREVGSLSLDEQKVLATMQEYQMDTLLIYLVSQLSLMMRI